MGIDFKKITLDSAEDKPKNIERREARTARSIMNRIRKRRPSFAGHNNYYDEKRLEILSQPAKWEECGAEAANEMRREREWEKVGYIIIERE